MIVKLLPLTSLLNSNQQKFSKIYNLFLKDSPIHCQYGFGSYFDQKRNVLNIGLGYKTSENDYAHKMAHEISHIIECSNSDLIKNNLGLPIFSNEKVLTKDFLHVFFREWTVFAIEMNIYEHFNAKVITKTSMKYTFKQILDQMDPKEVPNPKKLFKELLEHKRKQAKIYTFEKICSEWNKKINFLQSLKNNKKPLANFSHMIDFVSNGTNVITDSALLTPAQFRKKHNCKINYVLDID